MTKPDDIPQDVWDAAVFALYGQAPDEWVRDHAVLISRCARAILAAKAEEREAAEALTVAVAAVVAEAETMTMVMRRRRVFEHMKDRLYAYRNRLVLDEVNTAHKNSVEA